MQSTTDDPSLQPTTAPRPPIAQEIYALFKYW